MVDILELQIDAASLSMGQIRAGCLQGSGSPSTAQLGRSPAQAQDLGFLKPNFLREFETPRVGMMGIFKQFFSKNLKIGPGHVSKISNFQTKDSVHSE